MNTKMDFVMDSKKTAERAEAKADLALVKTAELEKVIDGIKKLTICATGLIVLAILTIAGLLVTILFQ
ncbi:hypothetical protein [Peribacillus sp. FSL E2-0159]|uniref:hypothetical protein n=1 Tax=Peribacillus sp. FSL E2-0159 TaxID=2975289 RepID=UPI00315A536A